MCSSGGGRGDLGRLCTCAEAGEVWELYFSFGFPANLKIVYNFFKIKKKKAHLSKIEAYDF